MQIENLKVFCDLVETRSFSGAAERNNVTQSAVSQKVRSLEEHYGVTLIERGAGRKFRLTPEGRIFFDGCLDVLARYDEIPRRLLKASGELRGEVRMATLPGIGLYRFAARRRRFRRLFPGVRVDAVYSSREKATQQVADGTADAALLTWPTKGKGYQVEICWQEKLVLVCPLSHRLARYGTIGLRDLRGERLIECAPDPVSAAAIRTTLDKAKVEVCPVFEVRSVESALRGVEVEGAVAILPEEQVQGQGERYRIVDINSMEMWRPVGVVLPATRSTTPALSEFIRTLKSQD